MLFRSMVQLIQNQECRFGLACPLKDRWSKADLLIGHDSAVIIGGFAWLIVRQRRIQLQTDFSGRLGPLGAQMVGRAYDQDTPRGAFCEKVMRDAQGKTRFSGRRRGHGEKVRGLMAVDRAEGSPLPVAERSGPRR